MIADLVPKLEVHGIEELASVVDPPNTRRIFNFLTK